MEVFLCSRSQATFTTAAPPAVAGAAGTQTPARCPAPAAQQPRPAHRASAAAHAQAGQHGEHHHGGHQPQRAANPKRARPPAARQRRCWPQDTQQGRQAHGPRGSTSRRWRTLALKTSSKAPTSAKRPQHEGKVARPHARAGAQGTRGAPGKDQAAQHEHATGQAVFWWRGTKRQAYRIFTVYFLESKWPPSLTRQARGAIKMKDQPSIGGVAEMISSSVVMPSATRSAPGQAQRAHTVLHRLAAQRVDRRALRHLCL